MFWSQFRTSCMMISDLSLQFDTSDESHDTIGRLSLIVLLGSLSLLKQINGVNSEQQLMVQNQNKLRRIVALNGHSYKNSSHLNTIQYM